MDTWEIAIRVLWTLWALLWGAAALAAPRAPALRRDRPASLALQYALNTAGALLLFNPWRVGALGRGWAWDPGLWGGLGLGLSAAGLGLALWARYELGDAWNGVAVVKSGQGLVRGGPYALSRHPIYTGVLTAALGLGLARRTWSGLAGVALLGVSLGLKARVEEGLLREHFGDAYRDYAAKVGRLLPWPRPRGSADRRGRDA